MKNPFTNMDSKLTQQSSEHPAAQPKYILRGHTAQIHSVLFLRSNTRILTGDADGWVVLWDTATKRAVAVWKAHGTTILGLGRWWDDGVITHGRDNKLYVWQLKPEDEKELSKNLPIENASEQESTKPNLLHALDVNTLNFCSFAMCHTNDPKTLLIATPGVQDGHINITSLPTNQRIATIPAPKGLNTGMIMALGLFLAPSKKEGNLQVLTGYESGHACIWTQQTDPSSSSSSSYQVTYLSKPHTQPILSLGIASSQETWFTSGADAIIARHPLFSNTTTTTSGETEKTLQTKHSGQQDLSVRNHDQKIFATAGWDGRVRVYSVKSMRELAVLKWHGEGCYAVAFAEVDVEGEKQEEDEGPGEVGKVGKGTVKGRREEIARRTHWLAAGSKDGKVSLWEIY